MSAVMQQVDELLMQLVESVRGRLWDSYFPEDGPYSRYLFPKHMEFITATKSFDYLNIFGANRSSKSVLLSYIFSSWAMGKYGTWWDGFKFEKAPVLWVAGQTNDLVKESWQKYMFGDDGYSGMVAPECIEHVTFSQQVPGLINNVLVKCPFGLTRVILKSYDQGWRRFQTGTVDAVGFDEEMETMIYTEACTRVATTNGKVLSAFTALKGITPLVQHLWPEGVSATDSPDQNDLHANEENKSRFTTFIGWADIPYSVLSEERRKKLRSQYPANELKARTEGIPHIGSGMVYPVAEEEISVEPFEIPDSWPRAFALDPGFKGKTAGLWGAWDEDSDTIYFYSEHYVGLQEPAVHVDAFRRRPGGRKIPCIIDPSGANQNDGKRTKQFYAEAMHALNPDWPIVDAQKSITTGIMEVYSRMTSGRLKIFSTCRNWFTEFRQYHRDDHGKIAPTPDHLMDDSRYLCLGLRHFKLVFVKKEAAEGKRGNLFDHW